MLYKSKGCCGNYVNIPEHIDVDSTDKKPGQNSNLFDSFGEMCLEAESLQMMASLSLD